MRTSPAVPYLLPSDDALDANQWTTIDGSPIPDRLAHWDPFTNTEVTRTITLDMDRVRADCQLGMDATFSLSAGWHSSSTRLAGGPAPVELADLDGLLRVDLPL